MALIRPKSAIVSRKDSAISERKTATTPTERKTLEHLGTKTKMKETNPKVIRYRTTILHAQLHSPRKTKRDNHNQQAAKLRTNKTTPTAIKTTKTLLNLKQTSTTSTISPSESTTSPTTNSSLNPCVYQITTWTLILPILQTPMLPFTIRT